MDDLISLINDLESIINQLEVGDSDRESLSNLFSDIRGEVDQVSSELSWQMDRADRLELETDELREERDSYESDAGRWENLSDEYEALAIERRDLITTLEEDIDRLTGNLNALHLSNKVDTDTYDIPSIKSLLRADIEASLKAEKSDSEIQYSEADLETPFLNY